MIEPEEIVVAGNQVDAGLWPIDDAGHCGDGKLHIAGSAAQIVDVKVLRRLERGQHALPGPVQAGNFIAHRILPYSHRLMSTYEVIVAQARGGDVVVDCYSSLTILTIMLY